VIVIASCTTINLTLPIWLHLAKLRDERKFLGKPDIMEDNDDESESDNEENIDRSDTSSSNNNEMNERKQGSGEPRDTPSVLSDSLYSMASSTIASQLSNAILEARPRKLGRADRNKRRRRKQRERDIRLAVGMQKSKLDEERFDGIEMVVDSNRNFSYTGSVMSKLSVNDVSLNDGVNEKEVTGKLVRGIDSPYVRRSCCQLVLEVSEWDSSLASLSFFYMVQLLVQKIVAIVEVAIIGHAIGITEANAFIMVTFLFQVTGVFVVGFEEAIGVLVPQAEGSDNDLMVGRYLQIGTMLNILFQIPGFLFWSFFMYDTIIWFGFDEATAIISQKYTYSSLMFLLVEHIDECLMMFLDVNDREKYVTIYTVIRECLFVGVIAAMAYNGVSNMVAIGLAQTLVAVTILFVNIMIVVNKGWFDDYSEGLFKSSGFKDWRAMRTTFVTAIPLGITWLLSIGEWQVMLIFAQYIGPDEVAVWNLLSFIWDLFEALTEAISGAAEVRVGFRMGAGKPQEARKMSEKSIYFGAQLAIITAGILFVIVEYVLPLITPNLVYQRLMFEQIPLIGFGGILMVPGLVVEGIFCAQARIRLMTTIEIIVSWFIAIPIAALLVYRFKSGLDGIVSGLVAGYSCGATLLMFFFLRSNWEQLSETVIKQNAAEGLQYVDTDWDDLPLEVQNAASILGFTKLVWESDGMPDTTKKSWNELSESERAAASVLGYNMKKWHGERNSTEGANEYDEYDFDDLPSEVKKAAKCLGFTRSIWDNDGKIPLESKAWADLTEAQQNAACTIGYTKEKWEGGSDSSSSSSDRSILVDINAMPVIPEEKEATLSEVVNYENYDFKDLPAEVKEAARFLGYTPLIWNNDGTIAIDNKDWNDLSKEEQNAAHVLGYSRDKWDHGSDSNFSSSQSSNSNTIQVSKRDIVHIKKARDHWDVASSPGDKIGACADCNSICSVNLWAPWDEPPLPNLNENVQSENSPHHVTNYGNHHFDELPSDKKRAALILGITRSTWDKNLFIPRKSKTWNSLSPAEMAAAHSLGCTEEKWEKLLDSW